MESPRTYGSWLSLRVESVDSERNLRVRKFRLVRREQDRRVLFWKDEEKMFFDEKNRGETEDRVLRMVFVSTEYKGTLDVVERRL